MAWTSVRATTTALVAIGVYILLVCSGRHVLRDPDVFWHIETGRWIFAHLAVPSTDPFSNTIGGTSWIEHEWLADVIFAAAMSLAGWRGVLALTALAIATAFALQTRFLLRHVRELLAIEIAIVAVVLIEGHALARPHALAYPILAAWCIGIVRAADENRSPSPWLLVLMPLWVNLHGSFLFGIAFIVPMALETLLRGPDRKRLARDWALFLAAALIAACMTPYGPKLLFTLNRVMDLGPVLEMISEWQPSTLSNNLPLFLVTLVGVGLAVYFRVRLPAIRILLIGALLLMALSHMRHTSLLSLVVPPLIAAPLGRQFGRPKLAPVTPVRLAGLASVGMVAIALTLVDRRPPDDIVPRAAVSAMLESTSGPVLNEYNFGGYLISIGVRPAIDGRADLYGGPFIMRYVRAIHDGDIGELSSLIAQYHIAATLLGPNAAAVKTLDAMPGWQRVYSDEIAVVHVRTE
ncbi:hypothetical protein ACE10Z_23745 [Bradyrhizobium sp. Pha-3]|uniref:hypothetical protein n=1 Tax=Bradyrhizobium sp. Pha-3 TaxID=208375 RepID=UPI0035D4B95D